MLQTQQVEELVCLVSTLDRDSLVRQFESYRASFPLDFTREYLRTTPLEKLKHIFVAVCLQSKHMPQIAPVV